MQHQLRARRVQAPADRRADPLGAAGDQYDFCPAPGPASGVRLAGESSTIDPRASRPTAHAATPCRAARPRRRRACAQRSASSPTCATRSRAAAASCRSTALHGARALRAGARLLRRRRAQVRRRRRFRHRAGADAAVRRGAGGAGRARSWRRPPARDIVELGAGTGATRGGPADRAGRRATLSRRAIGSSKSARICASASARRSPRRTRRRMLRASSGSTRCRPPSTASSSPTKCSTPIPPHVVARRDGTWHERGVTSRTAGASRCADRPLADGALLAAAGSVSRRTSTTRARSIRRRRRWSTASRGAARRRAFVIDYGFPAAEYYHPQRARGTVMRPLPASCAGRSALLAGSCRSHAHVDFSAIARGRCRGHDAGGLHDAGALPAQLRNSRSARGHWRSVVARLSARGRRGAEAALTCRDGRVVQGPGIGQRRWCSVGGLHGR